MIDLDIQMVVNQYTFLAIPFLIIVFAYAIANFFHVLRGV